MRAREVMTKEVVTVSPSDTLQQLARVLTDAGISGAPVVSETGEIVGMVSEADVIGKRGTTVQELMHRSVISVREDASVETVCALMAQNGINRVPVISDGKIVGIITRADVVQAIARGEVGRGTDQPEALTQVTHTTPA